MKVGIADNNGGKFTRDIEQHWIDQGHEVQWERGASPAIAQWADVYYIDDWDNNIHYLYKIYNGDPDGNRPKDWDNKKKPKFIARPLDWTVWIGYVRDQKIVDWVDRIVFIAPHIQQRVASEVILNGKDTLIRPGVNMDKFTLKQKDTDGFQLGMVLGNMWWMKNHMAGLDIFTQLYRKDKRWRFHIRGQHEGGNDYWKIVFDYYLKSRGIEDVVTLYSQQDDMNEWYENIDVLLHPGMKEAFCYAIGEAMAKGIPAIVNDFYGSRDIWPEHVIYRTHNEAVKMIQLVGVFTDAERIRDYIRVNHNMSDMLTSLDKLL